MIIPFRNFTGEFPRLEEHNLPDNAARTSHKSDFTSGILRGLRGDSLSVSSPSGVNSPPAEVFIRPNGTPFYWYTSGARACNSPVVNDAYSRLYWLDPNTGRIKVTKNDQRASNNYPSPTYSRTVGCPAPLTPPTATVKLGMQGSNDPEKTLTIGSYTVFDKVDGKLTNGITIPLLGILSASDVSAPTIVGHTDLSFTVGVGARTPSQTTGTLSPTSGSWSPLSNMTIKVVVSNAMLPVITVSVPVYKDSENHYCLQYSPSSGVTISYLYLLTAAAGDASALNMTSRSGGWWTSTSESVSFTPPTSTSPDAMPQSGGSPTAGSTGIRYVYVWDDESGNSGSWKGLTATYTDNGYYIYLDNTQTSVWVSENANGAAPVTYYRKVGTKYIVSSQSVVVPGVNEQPPTVQTTTAAVGLTNAVVKYVLTLDDGTTATGEVADGETISSGIPGVKVTLSVGAYLLNGVVYSKMREFRLRFFAETTETRNYVFTYKNEFGEEGPPSPPCEVECGEAAQVLLRFGAVPGYPVESENTDRFQTITNALIYRTATGGQANYLYVGSSYVSGSSMLDFKDTVASDALGHTLDTYGYYPPAPYNISSGTSGGVSEGMQGLCMMPNGIMVGFRKNELHFSEPYLPYAFNPKNIKPLHSDIVDIYPFEGGLYVTTKNEPCIVQGASPDTMTDMRIPTQQRCVSKGAICAFNGGVVYASPDGLVFVQGTAANMDMSWKFWTRRDWQAEYGGGSLSDMRLIAHDGMLLAYFVGSTSAAPFLIRYDEGEFSLTKLDGEKIYAATVSSDGTLLVAKAGSAALHALCGDTSSTRTWYRKSKTFILPKPTHFSAMQIYGKGNFTVKLYGDGTQIGSTYSFDNASLTRVDVRLPPVRARKFYVEVAAQASGAELHEMFIANSIQELRNV